MTNYREPSDKELYDYSILNKRNIETDYYSIREEVRILINGPVPLPYRSWGDYWKMAY